MAPYQIFTDATVDCNLSWLQSLSPVSIIPMQIEIGGREYSYGLGGSISAEEFYA